MSKKFDNARLRKAATPTIPLSASEKKIIGIAESDDVDPETKRPYVALKYFDNNFECFSEWSPEELKAFSLFIEKIGKHDWNSIFNSGGKLGHKTGLGYTRHDRSKLKKYTIPKNISPDINLFELRVTDRARVHGFRSKSIFFLMWLDKDHKIYKM